MIGSAPLELRLFSTIFIVPIIILVDPVVFVSAALLLWLLSNDLCVKNNTNRKSPQGDHHYLYKALAKSNIKIDWFPKDFWDIRTQSLSPFGGSKH